MVSFRVYFLQILDDRALLVKMKKEIQEKANTIKNLKELVRSLDGVAYVP